MVIGKIPFPDRFKKNPREAELSIFQGPRIIPSSFKSLEAYVFKNLMQTVFNNDYTGWDANLNGTGAPNFENLHFDTFNDSSKVATQAGFLVSGKTLKYSDMDYFIDIYADSISAIADFEINDCLIYQHYDGSNIWRLFCSTGTAAVKRAQIMKTLFYGSDGSNPRASSTYITNCTALKCSAAADVGKRAYLERVTGNLDQWDGQYSRDGTFAVGANTNVNTWTKLIMAGGSADHRWMAWELPEGTALISRTTLGTTDELGTATTGDDTDNPTDCQQAFWSDTNYVNGTIETILLTKQAITWATTEGGSGASASLTVDTDLDFFTDNSMPLFTQAALEDVTPFGTSTKLTLSRIINGIFLTVNYVEDLTLDAAFDVSADDGATWTENITPNAFTLLKRPGKEIVFRVRKTGTNINNEITIYEWAIVAADFATED